jgi:hypothetical protein
LNSGFLNFSSSGYAFSTHGHYSNNKTTPRRCSAGSFGIHSQKTNFIVGLADSAQCSPYQNSNSRDTILFDGTFNGTFQNHFSKSLFKNPAFMRVSACFVIPAPAPFGDFRQYINPQNPRGF